MNSFLESARSNAARGWSVFPLNGKYPRIPKAAGGSGFKDATLDPEKITAWWTKYPTANVGIACGVSNLYVVDMDYGLSSQEDFDAWRMRNNIPVTYTVRSGGRPDFRVQMYYTGAVDCNGKWELDGCKGEIRSIGGYVCAAGSIHPDTGETYQVLVDAPLAPRPGVFERAVTQVKNATVERKPGEKITGNRNMTLVSEVGKFRHANPGVSEDKTVAYFQQWNIEDVADPMSMDEVEEAVRKQFRLYDDVGQAAKASIGAVRRLYHSDLAKDFLSGNQDFYRVYDIPGQPLATWRQSRWVISDDTGLLRSAVRDYLEQLFESLPYKYEKGKPDYRAKLKSASFCRDVTAEVLIKVPPIKHDAFDRNEYLLCVDGGLAAELKTATVRPVRREDFTSQRLYLKPDYAMPTPRFDRFMDEITLNNWELKGFLLRLMALCLTAHPYQGLFFFWGKGRNGKGVLLRLLSRILGKTFTCTFRPNELTASKYNEDKAMRSFNKLEGKRLATIDESVGSNLNLSVLKLMSGGDELSAAKMRQDERQFSPTHKNIFPTNEKPELPNDQAFQGRTFFVPFKADYSDRAKQDATLETTLSAEAPGILAQLVSICPDVIVNGLRPPAIVLDATSELLQENDIATQFREDVLMDTVGQNVALTDMETAIQKWLNGGTGVVARASQYGGVDRVLDGLKARYEYKRLRPDGKHGRRVYHFLDVAFCEPNSQ
jgi:P4 family phage/plasmid primase-like protien